MIIQTYDKWEKSPVILTFDEKPIPTSTIPFPAVTICPELKFKHELFNFTDFHEGKTLKQIRLENALHSICPLTSTSKYTSDINVTDDLRSIAIPFNEVFTSCLYQSTTIYCHKIFYEVITDEGICYSFNMLNHKDMLNDIIDESLKYPKHDKNADSWTLQDGYTDMSSTVYPERVLGSGLSMSLEIWLKMRKRDMEFKCKGFSNGFRLFLHSPSEVPRFSKDYYPIPMKKTIQFSVNPEVIKTSDGLRNYKPEIRQCHYDVEKPLKFFKVYTQSNCELECLSNFTQRHCDCVKLGQPHDHGTRMCTKLKEVCYTEAESFWTNGSLNQNLIVNDCDCLPSCTSLEYTAEISQSDFYHEEFFKALNIKQEENL